jgi:DNA modification methylase
MTGLNLDTIECADVMDYLRGLPDACVNLVVTSPPYFGLRSYLQGGHEDKAREIGTEQTPAAYVARMVDVFREVRRVLRPDGNVYVNLGDSYAGGKQGRDDNSGEDLARRAARYGSGTGEGRGPSSGVQRKPPEGFTSKALMLIPHRFAIAMQDDGWLLREDIVWQKPNPMPESVRDRCTRSHEYIFHFTKGPRYWYDAQAVAEEAVRGAAGSRFDTGKTAEHQLGRSSHAIRIESDVRNRRSVWTINPANFREAHFATFPEDIPEICIKAACPEGGIVLDPFAGAGTVGLVAKKLNRRYIGCDLSAEYVRMAEDRINGISYTLFSLMEVASEQ